MTTTLRDLLDDGKVHVLDGAMGTMLYSKGFFLNVCYDELNLKQPKLVQEVHEAYVRAGAEILETNTFGANPLKLGSYGLADDTEKINQAAAELARRAAAGRASVAGAIGPLGVRIEPFGPTAREEAFAYFQRQARGLVAGGVDGFILETFSDVDEIHEALRAVRSVSDLPVIAQMTIGDDGLTHYGTGPTPEHIKKIRDYVASVVPRHQPTVVSRETIAAPAGVEEVPLATRSCWGAKLARGELVTSVEIVPPKGVDPTPMLEQCRALKAAGVDAVNVPDGPRAQSRMGVLPSAILIQKEVGIETVIHYCCRDRNLLGMLSDILGAHAAGLRNILIITGDPPKMGPYPEATAVFDIDSIGLTNLVYRLNHGLDPGNNPIGTPTQWAIGVGVNPGAVDLDRELSRFAWKVDAGAEFAVTQPVFDVRQLEAFLKRVEQFKTPIVAGVWPLISLRNAECLANEVPGVSVPEAVLQRMRKAQEKGKEAALAEGVAIAHEMFTQVKQLVQGVQVSAPFGRVEVALQVFR